MMQPERPRCREAILCWVRSCSEALFRMWASTTNKDVTTVIGITDSDPILKYNITNRFIPETHSSGPVAAVEPSSLNPCTRPECESFASLGRRRFAMAHRQAIERGTKQFDVSRSNSHAPRRQGLALAFAAAGAISFWLPDVVVHAEAGPKFDATHAWAITVLAPAMFLAAYLVARRFALKHHFKSVGPTMLLGVWLSGGLFMTMAAILSRSELIGGTGLWRLVVIVLSVIPIVTYILAAYDGSLFALLAVTMGGLLICGARSAWLLWASNPGETPNMVVVHRPAPRDQSKAA
jgi:hypothetical protein